MGWAYAIAFLAGIKHAVLNNEWLYENIYSTHLFKAFVWLLILVLLHVIYDKFLSSKNKKSDIASLVVPIVLTFCLGLMWYTKDFDNKENSLVKINKNDQKVSSYNASDKDETQSFSDEILDETPDEILGKGLLCNYILPKGLIYGYYFGDDDYYTKIRLVWGRKTNKKLSSKIELEFDSSNTYYTSPEYITLYRYKYADVIDRKTLEVFNQSKKEIIGNCEVMHYRDQLVDRMNIYLKKVQKRVDKKNAERRKGNKI